MNNEEEPRPQILVRIPRRLVGRAVMGVIAAVVLIGVLAVAFAMRPAPSRAHPKRLRLPEAFCCPSEARRLAATVNESVEPCDDFYSYVCTTSVTEGTDMSRKLLGHLEAQIADKDAKASNVSSAGTSLLPRSRAVDFLRELYASCEVALTAKPQRDSLGRKVHVYYVQTAEALLEMEKDSLTRLTETNFLAFLLSVNLRYQIHSVIEIEYRSVVATFLVRHGALNRESEMHEYFPECISAALTAYNENENRSDYQQGVSFRPVTFEDVRNFATRLHALYPKDIKREVFAATNMSRLLPGEAFTEALRKLPWFNYGGISVVARGAEQIAVLAREITENKNWAVGVVYLVAHTIAKAYLDVPGIVSEQKVRPTCLRFATGLQHTVNTAYLELYGTPENERIIKHSFISVRDVVAFEAASSLVSNDDKEADRRLHTLTANLTFITAAPKDFSVGEMPDAVEAHFGRNLLLGRSSEFRISKIRAALGLPLDLSQENPALHAGPRLFLEVPASFHSFINASRNPSPLTMAVLDVRLAQLLWRIVLSEHRKVTNVKKLLRCFGDAQRPSRPETTESANKKYAAALQLAVTSLALRSAMRVPSFQDWYKEFDIGGGGGNAADSRRFSNVQFFFLKDAYERCPRGSEWPDEDSINIPVAYTPEFRRAFGCSRTARTEEVKKCTL